MLRTPGQQWLVLMLVLVCCGAKTALGANVWLELKHTRAGWGALQKYSLVVL